MDKYFSNNLTQKELLMTGTIAALGITTILFRKSSFHPGLFRLSKDLGGRGVMRTRAETGELAQQNFILGCKENQKTPPSTSEPKSQTPNKNTESNKTEPSQGTKEKKYQSSITQRSGPEYALRNFIREGRKKY